MKILMVTPSYYPIIGGSEVLTRLLAIKLNEMGIHTDIMTFNMDKKWYPVWKEETKRDNQIRVFRVPALNPFPRLPNPLFNLFRMNVLPKPSFIKKFKDYDVIHFVGEADLSFPILSYFVKKPKIFHCVAIFRHGGIYKYYMFRRPFLGNIFKRFFPNLADAYTIYSIEEKTLLTDLGVPAKKILSLPIGIDTEIFRPDETKKIDNLILFVGRIYRIKGLHILINALPYLEIPIQLAIIGPRWDEEYVKEIEQMSQAINENGVHNVRLLGAMDHSDLVSWYQKASVLVCPYLYETYNAVTLEALACGTPVVSTGTHIMGQTPDGILVTSKDPKKIADAIRKLLEDRELREKYGREGRKLIEEHFSVEVVAKKLTKIYMDLLTD